MAEFMDTPPEMTANYAGIGAEKAGMGFGKTMMLAILAGAFIGMAGVASAAASVQGFGVPAPVARLLGAICFPTGLAMVVLAGAELFTGDTLAVISVFEKRISALRLLRLWMLVWAGNFIGGVIVAALVTYGGTLDDLYPNGALAAATVATAVKKCSLTFQDAFFRGILCNFLVAGAVWMSLSAKEPGGKVLALFPPVMIFVLCGYEHSVANMYFVPAGIFVAGASYYDVGAIPESLTWLNFLWKNLVPVTLGNIVGGSVCIGAAYWLAYRKPMPK